MIGLGCSSPQITISANVTFTILTRIVTLLPHGGTQSLSAHIHTLQILSRKSHLCRSEEQTNVVEGTDVENTLLELINT